MKRRSFLQAVFILAATAKALPLLPAVAEAKAVSPTSIVDAPLDYRGTIVSALGIDGSAIETWHATPEMWTIDERRGTAVFGGLFRFDFDPADRSSTIAIYDIAVTLPYMGVTKVLPRAAGLPARLFAGDSLTVDGRNRMLTIR